MSWGLAAGTKINGKSYFTFCTLLEATEGKKEPEKVKGEKRVPCSVRIFFTTKWYNSSIFYLLFSWKEFEKALEKNNFTLEKPKYPTVYYKEKAV